MTYLPFLRNRLLLAVLVVPSGIALGLAAADSDRGQPWGRWVVAALAWLLLCAILALGAIVQTTGSGEMHERSEAETREGAAAKKTQG